jgi:hypothetical protein
MVHRYLAGEVNQRLDFYIHKLSLHIQKKEVLDEHTSQIKADVLGFSKDCLGTALEHALDEQRRVLLSEGHLS